MSEDWLSTFGRSCSLRWTRLPSAQKNLIPRAAIIAVAVVCFGTFANIYIGAIMLERHGNVVSTIIPKLLDFVSDQPDRKALSNKQILSSLDALLSDDVFLASFPYLDVWLPDGTLYYSNVAASIGQRPPMPTPVPKALSGEATVQFAGAKSESGKDHHIGNALIELTFPIRNVRTGEIMAAVQLSEVANSLNKDLFSLTSLYWTSVGAIFFLLGLIQYRFVIEGRRTIARQSRLLSKCQAHSHRRAAQYRDLKAQVLGASRELSDVTDKYLFNIGADLHDGPAQSIGFAVLRLGQLRRARSVDARNAVVSEVERVLADTLLEVRAIASGLVLPDIGSLTLTQIIERAMSLHEQRTGLDVAVVARVGPVQVSEEMAHCVFRFLQEGLYNAYRYGLHEGLSVFVTLEASVLKVSISNEYLPSSEEGSREHGGIGLYGLRTRVQGLGGDFHFEKSDGHALLQMEISNILDHNLDQAT